jgi:hypothetical protein
MDKLSNQEEHTDILHRLQKRCVKCDPPETIPELHVHPTIQSGPNSNPKESFGNSFTPYHNNNYSVALVHKRTIKTEGLPLVGEVSVNFCG